MTTQPPPPYAPQSARASASLPEWALPAMLALALGGGGGYVGGTNASGQDPAVLESRLQSLSDTVTSSNQAMSVKIDRLQQAVTDAGMDRFTRSDHNQWVATEHQPLRTRLESHMATEGHSSGMRIIERHEAELERHESRITELERQLRATPTPSPPGRR